MINKFEYRGESYAFSSGSIQGAINALKNEGYQILSVNKSPLDYRKTAAKVVTPI